MYQHFIHELRSLECEFMIFCLYINKFKVKICPRTNRGIGRACSEGFWAFETNKVIEDGQVSLSLSLSLSPDRLHLQIRLSNHKSVLVITNDLVVGILSTRLPSQYKILIFVINNEIKFAIIYWLVNFWWKINVYFLSSKLKCFT